MTIKPTPMAIANLGPTLDSNIYPVELNIKRANEFIGPKIKVSLIVRFG
jgi:hypothetical protein